MDFSNYLFRCHYQGSLVSTPRELTERQAETLRAYRERAKGNGRPLTEKQTIDWHSLETKEAESKIYSLTDTAKNICTNIVFYEKFNRKFTLENKYFHKGLEVEKASRDLVSDVLGTRLIVDTERKTNDWVTGQRDIKHDDLIIDIKSTYDFVSFNKHLIDTNDEFYFRQLDSYMDLWGIKQSLLAYVLVNSPFRTIEDEIRRIDYKENIKTIEGDIRDESIERIVNVVQNHIFDRKYLEDFCQQSSSIKIEWFINFKEVPVSDRLHLIPHSYDDSRIKQRNECLRLCREFMNTVKPMNNINYNLK